MVKKKSNKLFEGFAKELIVVVGLLLFVFLVSNHQFMGSLLGGYENNEPTDMGSFLATIDLYNGQYSPQNPLVVGNSSYVTYYTTSDLGVITVSAINDKHCSDVLLTEHSIDNSTAFVVLKGRQVLDLNSGYWYCNFRNNLLLQVSSYQVFSDYVDSFESFTTVNGSPAATNTSVVVGGSNYSSSPEPTPSPATPPPTTVEEPKSLNTNFGGYLLITLLLLAALTAYYYSKNHKRRTSLRRKNKR